MITFFYLGGQVVGVLFDRTPALRSPRLLSCVRATSTEFVYFYLGGQVVGVRFDRTPALVLCKSHKLSGCASTARRPLSCVRATSTQFVYFYLGGQVVGVRFDRTPALVLCKSHKYKFVYFYLGGQVVGRFDARRLCLVRATSTEFVYFYLGGRLSGALDRTPALSVSHKQNLCTSTLADRLSGCASTARRPLSCVRATSTEFVYFYLGGQVVGVRFDRTPALVLCKSHKYTICVLLPWRTGCRGALDRTPALVLCKSHKYRICVLLPWRTGCRGALRPHAGSCLV
ncbi:hypothetical protein J6590_102932 [Homalodisca vitripennis]|nr:hypothetical protein J6590_102932 [Homalodisca vitripennis]